MSTTTKIANLLLSEEQANKDLAFSLIESLGVDFGEVCEEMIGLICTYAEIGLKKDIEILGFELSMYGDGDTCHAIIDVWYFGKEIRLSHISSQFPTIEYNLLYDGKLDGDHKGAINLFVSKIKQAYNGTKQSRDHNRSR